MVETPVRPISILEQKLEALLAYALHLESENAAYKTRNQQLIAQVDEYSARQSDITERLEHLLASLKSLEVESDER